MRKRIFFVLGLLMAVAVQTWAEELLCQTVFNSSNNSGKISSYTNEWTNTTDGFTVAIVNANNNSNGWEYIKFGSKNDVSVGSITTAAPIAGTVEKVVVTIDAVTASKINSIKLLTSLDGSSYTECASFTVATGAQTAAVPVNVQKTGLYYQIKFDCMKGSSNGLISVSKVEFYGEPGAIAPKPTATLSADAETVNVGDIVNFSFVAQNTETQELVELVYQNTTAITASTTTDSFIKFTSSGTYSIFARIRVDDNKIINTNTISVIVLSQPSSATITVQLSPNSPFIQNWTSVGLYAWLTNENDVYIRDVLGSWPGIVVSKDAKTGWYSYTFTGITDKLHIIWNNNDGETAYRQSVDIDTVYESTCYMLLDETDIMEHAYYSVVTCPSDTTIIPIDPDTTIIPIDPDTTIIPIDPDTTIIPIDPDTTIIPIDPDTTIIPAKTYTLKVAAANGGSVNNTGGTYKEGTSISLKATAKSGYRFHSWSDGNTESPRAMKITQDEALFATFLPEYRLTISAETGGKVNNSVNGLYTEAFCVEIEATPDEGWKFLRWSDYETDNPRTVYMTESLTLSAIFNQRQGLDDVVSGNVTVWDAGGRIGIRSSEPQDITIYTAAGRVLTVLTTVSETSVAVPTGLYIVRTNNQSYKLIVK